jgi:two-component system, NtrC family, response regulator HydG
MRIQTELIGVSGATRRVLEDVDCAAGTDAKVLLTGESGVGKEVVAQLIHRRSNRASAKLIAINCAGVPDSLLASELFGHVRGSFTDAHRDKQGWLEQAHRGTIFMDEVGEVSLQMQAALLRFLENGEIQRVGAERRSAVVDVRIIAATNRRLIDRVAANEFREDLFYRLNVINLEMPALRARPSDIPLLAGHFLRKYAAENAKPLTSFTGEALEHLAAHSWPGNVRELENVVERAVVLAQSSEVGLSDLPPQLAAVKAREGIQIPGASMDEIERYAITKTLEATGGATSKAAEILNISVRKIQYKLHEYESAPKSARPPVTDDGGDR